MTKHPTFQSHCRKINSLDVDVLVAGGGIAGICTAVAAARNGARVILCQDRPVLGGNASSEIRMHICGATISGKRGQALQVEPRETGIVEEIQLENAARNPHKSWSMMDLILYEKCTQQENMTLLLNTTVVAVDVSNDSIRSVQAIRESTEDEFHITAKIFVDCTGDGRLGAEAGALYRTGREAAREFNESFAPEEPDHKKLGSSLLFEAVDTHHPSPFTAPLWARTFTEEDLEFRDHHTVNTGYWWIEWGGHLDTIKDNARIHHELLRSLLGVWDHIKNTPNHNAETMALDWIGQLPGKRESRRFVGLYTFSQSDAEQAPHFDDAVAFGGWPMDTHPPEGIDAPRVPACSQPIPQYLYSIPLRCCISKNISNLMFAGRNISATHIGFSTLRVMATCGVIGQAVGTAAAYSVKTNKTPHQIIEDQNTILSIQKQLLDDDCFIPGIDFVTDTIIKPDRVVTSSQTPDGTADNVISPTNRAVFGQQGIHPRYNPKGTNRWIADLNADPKPTLEFHWDSPVEIKQIKLVFDTGLHRPLMLTKDTSCQSLNDTMLWQIPPELVKAYRIEIKRSESPWQPLLNIQNNVQRLNRHSFDATTLDALRLTILETHGLDQARVVNLSCY